MTVILVHMSRDLSFFLFTLQLNCSWCDMELEVYLIDILDCIFSWFCRHSGKVVKMDWEGGRACCQVFEKLYVRHLPSAVTGSTAFAVWPGDVTAGGNHCRPVCVQTPPARPSSKGNLKSSFSSRINPFFFGDWFLRISSCYSEVVCSCTAGSWRLRFLSIIYNVVEVLSLRLHWWILLAVWEDGGWLCASCVAGSGVEAWPRQTLFWIWLVHINCSQCACKWEEIVYSLPGLGYRCSYLPGEEQNPGRNCRCPPSGMRTAQRAQQTGTNCFASELHVLIVLWFVTPSVLSVDWWKGFLNCGSGSIRTRRQSVWGCTFC